MARKCIGAALFGGGLGIATALIVTLSSGCGATAGWGQHTATGLKIAACVQGVLAEEYATKEEQARELAKRETEAARLIELEAEAAARIRTLPQFPLDTHSPYVVPGSVAVEAEKALQ